MKSVPSLLVAATFTLCLASLTTGCPGAAEGEGEGEGEGGGDVAPADVKAALDGYLDRCGASFLGVTAEEEPTLSAILAPQLKPSIDASFDAQSTDPNISFDAVAGAKCIDELNTLGCDFNLIATGAPDCVTSFVGKLQVGDACATNDECAATASCFGLDVESGTCGACTARAASGADCSAADCVDGFECDGGVCTASAAALHEGDACPQGTCFDDSLVCDDTTQQCTALVVVQVGDACDGGAHYCVDQATKNFCDPTSHQCTARAGLNGDCSTIPLCDATVATCDATSGTCVAVKAAGGACGTDDVCTAGFQCDTTCVAETSADVTPNPTCN